MQVPARRRVIARFGIVAALALTGSLLMVAPSLAKPTAHDPFVPSASDGGESGDAVDTRDPAHFDAEAAANPVKGSEALFSECRFAPFAGNTSVYPALAPNEHDVIENDTTFALAGNTSCYNPQNEQNIVVNPTNRNNVVTSSNDYRGVGTCEAYASFDAGSTWHDYVIGGWQFPDAKGVFVRTGCGGDPVLAFGPDGTLYYAGLTFNLDKLPRNQMSGVAVSKSTDGGRTWAAPVMVSYNATGNFFYDKPWISVSNDGTVNLTWTKFYQGPTGLGYLKSPIVMSQSRTGGKTWSAVKQVADASHPFDQASQTATAPDGTLYLAYEAADPDTGYSTDAVVVASSTNDGSTFTTRKVARVYDDLDCYPVQLPGGQGRATLTDEQFRLPDYPSMAIDPTTGLIAITWSDDQGAGTCGNGGTSFSGTTSNQVKVATSANGSSWSTQTITTTAPDKWFPSVGANDGVLAVSYETRDYATTPGDPLCEADVIDQNGTITALSDHNVCYDDAAKVSTDGGQTWSDQVRISSQSSNPYLQFAGAFIGDYEGTAVDSHGKVYAVWTDNRGNPGVTWPNQDTYVGTLPAD